MAVCYSAAWDAKVITSAWWVYHNQVRRGRLFLLTDLYIFDIEILSDYIVHMLLAAGVQNCTNRRVLGNRKLHD